MTTNERGRTWRYGSSGDASGFTLLELLVAITLIAMMSVGVWAALDMSIRAWLRGVEAIDVNQRDRSTLDLVRKQIASAYPILPTPTASDPGTQTGTQVPTAVSSSSSNSPVFSGGETSMRFVSPNSLLLIDSVGLVLVAYEVEVDSDNNIALVQREAPYTGQGVDEGGFISAVAVFRNLRECIFEYYFPGDTSNPAAWLTEWDTSGMRRLPAAVRISMLYKELDRGTPGRQMVIPLRAQTNYQSQVQQTPGRQVQQPQSKPGGGGQPKSKPGNGLGPQTKPKPGEGGGGMGKPGGGGGMGKPGSGGGMGRPGGGGF